MPRSNCPKYASRVARFDLIDEAASERLVRLARGPGRPRPARPHAFGSRLAAALVALAAWLDERYAERSTLPGTWAGAWSPRTPARAGGPTEAVDVPPRVGMVRSGHQEAGRPMRITHTDVWPVVVPTRTDAVNSPDWGDDGWGGMEHILIRVHTDEGLTGLGETQRGVPRSAVQAAAEALAGQDPLQICLQEIPLHRDVSQALVGAASVKYPPRLHELRMPRNPAYDAFEIALFDLVGKALGVPVHKLLGGAYRERVPVDFWFGRRSPEDAYRLAKRAREMGYHGLKMKNALEDPTVEQVDAIVRAAGPDFQITIDPNERFYRPAEAIRLARELERYPNVAMFEDPMPKWNLDWYRLFRQKTSIPVTLHLGPPQDVINAIKAEACDYMNLGGSMVNFVKCAAIAEAAGIPIWHGSGVDLGLLETSYVHASSVCRNCVLNGDMFGRLIREHDLLATPLEIRDGHATVPQRPGLGVELDMDAVEKYRAQD